MHKRMANIHPNFSDILQKLFQRFILKHLFEVIQYGRILNQKKKEKKKTFFIFPKKIKPSLLEFENELSLN